MPKLVLDLKDRRPAWSMPPWVPMKISEALPPGWDLHVVEAEADGSGDGMVNLGSELLRAVTDAEIYMGYGIPAALLREGRELRWVHSGAAGVGGSMTPEMLASPVLFTNSKGIHGPPMGDTALAMVLHFSRGLDLAAAGQKRGEWDTGPFYRADHPLAELEETTVGLFGFGGIGREIARRFLALGSRVLAFDRGPEVFGPNAGTRPGSGGGGDHGTTASGGGVEPLYGDAGFRSLLEESDYLILTAPETPRTRGVVNGAALARMKPTAVLINLSRGRIVEEEALVEALTAGKIRGAGLDVFAQEPLPSGHPLWGMPNVLITPHVSAVSRGFWKRQTDLILENLRRYFAGDPLLNQVDKEAGF